MRKQRKGCNCSAYTCKIVNEFTEDVKNSSQDWEKALNEIFDSHENSRSPRRNYLWPHLQIVYFTVRDSDSETIIFYTAVCMEVKSAISEKYCIEYRKT
jgi:hypothetical protein